MPAMVYIHGGGWGGGSKSLVPAWLLKAVRERWFAVVSVEYRFTDVATHPAQVNDCMRAIQFIRLNAADWNLDPERIGVTGASAGGHLALWVALHDDAADADSTDPVQQHSSRVACVVSFAGPTDWSLLNKLEHAHPGYRLLLGYEQGTPAEKMEERKMAHVSPISFVSRDDPPVMLVHGGRDKIVPIEHAFNIQKRLKSVGVKTELINIERGNHLSGASPEVFERARMFMREQLIRP
jgi:acetyl esterase/lipase